MNTQKLTRRSTLGPSYSMFYMEEHITLTVNIKLLKQSAGIISSITCTDVAPATTEVAAPILSLQSQ
jgi:hypothetical protein